MIQLWAGQAYASHGVVMGGPKANPAKGSTTRCSRDQPLRVLLVVVVP
jgi:hypothetical protein